MLHVRNLRLQRRTLGAATLVIALVAALGGTASAAIPHSTTNVITGCYANVGGSLRVIDAEAGRQCTRLEKQLTWNQAGVAGPQGPAGPTGPEGPQGPAGEPGSSAGDQVFFAADGPVFVDSPDRNFRLPKVLPAGSYVIEADVSATAAQAPDGKRTTRVNCLLPGGSDRIGKLMIIMPESPEPAPNSALFETGNAMTLTTAVNHAGGEVVLECFALDGPGVLLSATLLATAVASVG